MRNKLLSALGACAICTGFAHSLPLESGSRLNGDPCATEPTFLADCCAAPAAPPLAQLTQPDGNPRSAYPQTSVHAEILVRSLSSSVTLTRDPAVFLIPPGEKGNKLPENVPGRNLSPAIKEPKTTMSADTLTLRRFGDTPPQQRTIPLDR